MENRIITFGKILFSLIPASKPDIFAENIGIVELKDSIKAYEEGSNAGSAMYRETVSQIKLCMDLMC